MSGALMFSTACSDNKTNEKEGTHSEATSDSTSAYVCPMGCENSGSDKPGKCPVCGMDLEKNPKHK
jgi:rubrerythrin